MGELRDERDLVRRCREGSESAYAELVRSHRPRLFVLAFRLTGDRETAEDVVQETFLAAFRSIEKVDPRPSLSPWLNTIVLRSAGRAGARTRTRARRSSSLDQVSEREALSGIAIGRGLIDADPDTDPQAAAEAADLRRVLAAAIIDLPFKYRAAVVLRHIMGLDYAEAARELGVPLNTFKSHLLRGTRQLREALAGRFELEPPAPAPAGPTPTGPTLAGSVPPVDPGDGTGGIGRHRNEVGVGSE
ncbi:MAG: RNA polymerase sigma factor [Chloroflexi bacterium]|nr:RNA polymerase sigma factor [Chloroflexota bacterium]